MSISGLSKPLSSTPSSYQKFSPGLTPILSNNKIIRISAKGTPTTNSELTTNLYTRITRQQLNAQSLNPKVITHNPHSLQKEGLSASSRLIRSEVASTRNWEAECGVLKQTLESYKNRIVQLENKEKFWQNKDGFQNQKETEAYKVKLEETEQRMNEQNAYLRQCLTKLNTQLQKTSQAIPLLESSQLRLESINQSLVSEIQSKSVELRHLQENYNVIIGQVREQKSIGENVDSKLRDLQSHIHRLEEQNLQLMSEIAQNNKIKATLQSQLEEQRANHQSMLRNFMQMQKEVSSHKQHITELQEELSRIREDNEDMKRAIDDESKRSMYLSKSAYFNDSFQSDSTKINNLGSRIKKSYSTAIIQEPHNDEFDVNEYQQKAEQYRLLRMFVEIQRIQIPQSVSPMLTLGQYFKDSTNHLYNQKLQLRANIQKYKRLVDISWNCPNTDQQKSQEFITDLIEKCNLYESSLYQKKNTIDLLQNQLRFFKKESKNQGETKRKYNYLGREDECQKQKIIITKLEKELDHLNMKLTQSQDGGRKVVSANNSFQSTSALNKIKSFRPVGSSLRKPEPITAHSKLKNISGEQIVQQMENKLKFYEAEVVPELEAKISQYKGMLDTFHKELTHQNLPEEHLVESQVSVLSISQMGLEEGITSDKRRRRRVNTASFSDFRLSQLKQSAVTRPETSDSNISRQRKKRLDELTSDVSIKVLAAVTLRLCEIAQRMNKNQNYTIIIPSSVYLINYSDQYVGSLKIKILETPREKLCEGKKYWAPENISGSAFKEASLVWNIGVLLDETIHGRVFFSSEKQILDMKKYYRYERGDNALFKRLLERMLEKNEEMRMSLKEVESAILEEEQTLFN